MYETLSDFKNIVVSGPQRSGTRICAKVIAFDTVKKYIDEKEIANQDIRLLDWYLRRGNAVIQCPALAHMLHYIERKDTLIIMVRRPIDEIIASERRIGWPEASRFNELFKYGRCDGIISKVKYEFWENFQQPILGDRGRDINYHDLETHSLFIADRVGFAWDQTK